MRLRVPSLKDLLVNRPSKVLQLRDGLRSVGGITIYRAAERSAFGGHRIPRRFEPLHCKQRQPHGVPVKVGHVHGVAEFKILPRPQRVLAGSARDLQEAEPRSAALLDDHDVPARALDLLDATCRDREQVPARDNEPERHWHADAYEHSLPPSLAGQEKRAKSKKTGENAKRKADSFAALARCLHCDARPVAVDVRLSRIGHVLGVKQWRRSPTEAT